MRITRIVKILEDKKGFVLGFVYTRTSDGKIVQGRTIGGDSNIRWALCADCTIPWKANYYCYTTTDAGSWHRDVPYAGCKSEDILAFVTRRLKSK